MIYYNCLKEKKGKKGEFKMKKFNEEMYKGIKQKGAFEDQYYKYIVIDKKAVFKGWKTSYLSSQKYEFYGILDTTKKDIFTLDNSKELQEEFKEEAKQQVLNKIKNTYDYYLNLQKEQFNQREEAKKSILYYYNDRYSNNFNDLYIKGTTPEQLKKDLFNKIINVKNSWSDESFLQKYLIESKNNIIEEIAQNIFDANYMDEWDFNYNWNNHNEPQKIEFSFNNYISMELNKIELIYNEYLKIWNNPSELLKKCKKLYNICKQFKEENNNKTCTLYLDNGKQFKILDFDYLITICEQGNAKAISYRLLTGPERYQLERHNEEKGRGTREDDLFIEDIKKLEFSKKVIYEE